MNGIERVKLFALSCQLIESDLDKIEAQFSIDLGRDQSNVPDIDEEYYPQIEALFRQEAALMAKHYELFYSLERTIRALVRDKMEAECGKNWWEEYVPDHIQTRVKENIQKEIDSGITLRSTEEIDYTTFGELGEIVRHNWGIFSDTFNSQKAFTKIMTTLNTLRSPIAHCSPLADDEVLRLRLAVRDWFRLME